MPCQSAVGAVTLPRGAVVDSSGTVVARSLDPERWVGKDGRAAEIVGRALAEGEGTAVATGLDGTRRLYAYTRVAEVTVEEPLPTVLAHPATTVQVVRTSSRTRSSSPLQA